MLIVGLLKTKRVLMRRQDGEEVLQGHAVLATKVSAVNNEHAVGVSCLQQGEKLFCSNASAIHNPLRKAQVNSPSNFCQRLLVKVFACGFRHLNEKNKHFLFDFSLDNKFSFSRSQTPSSIFLEIVTLAISKAYSSYSLTTERTRRAHQCPSPTCASQAHVIERRC